MVQLTDTQLDAWRRDGWLRLPGMLPPDTVADVDRWVGDLVEWSKAGQPGLHHYEQTDHGPTLARTELFADDHDGLGGFVRGDLIGDVPAQLFGEPAVLFKEKVNYKQPGGAGFAPHQDAPAYRFVDHHISVMVPLDPATVASGCLYFAPGQHGGLLPTDERGRVADDVVQRLAWEPVEAEPGDLLFFDSYAPHRSGTNTTERDRRGLYLTYNAASDGDVRDRYYADKLAEFDREGGTFADQRVRISIVDDFLGRPADPVR